LAVTFSARAFTTASQVKRRAVAAAALSGAALVVAVVAGVVVSGGPAAGPTSSCPCGGLFNPLEPVVVGSRPPGSSAPLRIGLGRKLPAAAEEAAVEIEVSPGPRPIPVHLEPPGPPGAGFLVGTATTAGGSSIYAVVGLTRGGGIAISTGGIPVPLAVVLVGWYGQRGDSFTPLAPSAVPAARTPTGALDLDLGPAVPTGAQSVALSVEASRGPVRVTLAPGGADRLAAPTLVTGPAGGSTFVTVTLGKTRTVVVSGSGASGVRAQLLGYFESPGGSDHVVLGDRFVPGSGDEPGTGPAAPPDGRVSVGPEVGTDAVAAVLAADGTAPVRAGPAGWPAGATTPIGGFDPVLLGADQDIDVAGDGRDLRVVGWFEPLQDPPGQEFTSSWARPLPARAEPGPDGPALAWAAQVASQPGDAPAVNTTGSFGYPIYVAGPRAAGVGVDLGPPARCGSLADVRFPAQTGRVPIPAGAQVAGTEANSDSPLLVWQPASGTDWELWRAARTGGRWSACNGGRLGPVGASPGTWAGGPGLSASGISYLATAITEADVASGAIRHVMAFTVESGSCAGFVPPATRADGNCDAPGEPPEGTVLYLPAGLPMPAGLSPMGQLVFQALQTYGLVLVDESGRYVAAQAESSCDYPPSACRAGLSAPPGPARDPIGVALGSIGLRGIPWAELQALPPGRY
jgi:hypothetical protein